ncbi:MAG: type I DNA topoisomerase [Bacilli bacterium]
MKLVIVESPTKSKTIGRYLGEDYIVEASVGHIRDLATSGKGGLGVDVNDGFKPTYVISKDKKEVVKKLEKLKDKCDEVILATDPDREGEAIAWHLASVLNLDVNTTKRLEFHEITHDSITNAIKAPRVIDMNLVHSQEARRIIDRIIGFKLSNLMYSRIRSKSAGRVQSVTLKLIVDHEKEITDFKPEEYWTIESKIKKDSKDLTIDLVKVDDKVVKITNEKDCDAIMSMIGDEVSVSEIKKTERNLSSKDAFITSTLQQETFNKYHFKTKETTFLAQKLYEGTETDEGLTGLITYIRTDSTRLSDTFIDSAKDFIISKYGENYYKGKRVVKKNALMQDAHEAIRPTSLKRTPELMKKYLSDHEYKLYKLIYNRAVASLMVDKKVEATNVSFKTNNVTFQITGSVTIFKGYDVLNIDNDESNALPVFTEGEKFKLFDTKKEQHFTKAPARYSEGRIVRLMEEKGIGRPSTYASTIQTLISRKYVTSAKDGLTPSEQGTKTVTVLTKYFPDLMNTEYTADMETNLDKISDGSEEELAVIKNFYDPFITHFEEIKPKIYKDPLEYTGEKCPKCGSPLVVRHGRNGDFVACSNYPTCKYIEKKEKEPLKFVGRNCPNCGHPLVYRKSKSGDEFIGCSNFPKCRYVESINDGTVKEPEEKRYCPKCGGLLVKRKSKRGYFYGCSNYPKCHYIEPIKKNEE